MRQSFEISRLRQRLSGRTSADLRRCKRCPKQIYCIFDFRQKSVFGVSYQSDALCFVDEYLKLKNGTRFYILVTKKKGYNFMIFIECNWLLICLNSVWINKSGKSRRNYKTHLKFKNSHVLFTKYSIFPATSAAKTSFPRIPLHIQKSKVPVGSLGCLL